MEEYKTGKRILKDTIDEEYKIEDSEEERYLGDFITKDGKNSKNVSARRARGIGIVDKIFTYLNDVFLGPYFSQAALLFRSSFLINNILSNSESLYNLTECDIQQL